MILGPPLDVLNAFYDLKSSLVIVCLSVCDRNCGVFAPNGNMPVSCPIPVSKRGVLTAFLDLLLGHPVL